MEAIIVMQYRRFIAALLIGGAVAWGLALMPLERPRAVLPGSAWRVWFSPDSQFIVTHEKLDHNPKGCLKLWRLADGRELATLGDSRLWTSVTFSPDGSELASIRDPILGVREDVAVLIWETATGRVKSTIPRTASWGALARLMYRPDGTLIVAEEFGVMLKWRRASRDGEELWAKELPAETGCRTLGVMRDYVNRYCVYLSDGKVWILDLATGRVAETPEFSDFTNLDISWDGRTWAVTESKSENCYVANSTTKKWQRVASLDGCSELSLSPDGGFLAAQAWRVWDFDYSWLPEFLQPVNWEIRVARVSDGEIIGRYRRGLDSKFSPDGRTLAVFTDHETVELWDFPPHPAWGWLVSGGLGTTALTYLFLAWRARRRMRFDIAKR